MTLPGLLTSPMEYGAAALLAVSLTALFTLRAKRKAAAVSSKTADEQLIAKIDERLAAVANRVETHQTVLMNRLHDDIRGLQSDMDWLAGERMIEEAIAMVHAGQSPQDISSELGLSTEDAETISRFRKH